VAVGTGGTLYVTELHASRVSVWTVDSDGEYVEDVSRTITGLDNPRGVAVGTGDTLYVTEPGATRVSVWTVDPDEGYVRDTTRTVTGLSWPCGVAVGSGGTLYVAEAFAGVSVWTVDPDEGYVQDTTRTITRLSMPSGVAVGTGGTLYVAETGRVSVWTVGPDGGYVQDATRTITGLDNPSGVAVGTDGTLYIADITDGLYVVSPPVHSVTGQVSSTLGSGGSAWSGTVSVVKPSDNGSYTLVAGPVSIGSDGSFTVPDVPVGSGYLLEVNADGFTPKFSGSFDVADEDVNLSEPIMVVPEVPDGTGTDPGGTTPGGTGTTTPPPGGSIAVKVKAALGAVNLLKGKSYSLVALAYTDTGASVPVTYKSSKAKVATVSASGKVKAKKPGKTIVTIISGSQMTKVKVTVLKKRPSSAASKVKKVTVKLKKSLAAGQTVYLTPTLGPKTALAVKVTFKSAKKSIASIDKAGRLQALAKGKTTITVKAGKATKKLKLTVK
jgi:hypothetical protein